MFELSITNSNMGKLQVIREKFSTEEACLEYLSEIKWSNGYQCPKCGNKEYYKGRKKLFRKCSKCDFDESPTSGTLFHKIKFNIVIAFEMIYWITETKKGMSTKELANHFGVNQTTAWKFKRKIQLAMKQGDVPPLIGNVEVDEFMVGGKEKKAQGRSLGKKHIAILGIETMETKKGKKGIKKAFCQAIEGYGSDDFKPFFDGRIDKTAKVKTDKWTGYYPLKSDHKIKMVYSKSGKNFKELHNFIMNLKSWLRGIHHSVCGWHFQGYLDEFCFRFNNRFNKKSAWNILVQNMIRTAPVYGKNLYYGS